MISGISSGDDYSDNKIKIYNAKDDALIDARDEEDIPKLVSINKLEENREFNRMLRSIQDYQQEGKQVPIFDVSNKTTIIPKANTGFSFVNSAHANPMGSVATTMGGGIVGQDLALAIAFRTSTFLSKAPIAMGIVGTGMGLHNAAQFEAQHPLLSFEFNDIMTNPYISQKDKDSYWQKATNDAESDVNIALGSFVLLRQPSVEAIVQLVLAISPELKIVLDCCLEIRSSCRHVRAHFNSSFCMLADKWD